MGTSGNCAAGGTCSVQQNGFLSTPPSMAGSIVFVVTFAILIPGNFFYGMRYNTPLYSSTIIVGLLFEVVGWVGRILLSSNRASVSSFVIYMVGTIMGPAFITAAIYQILPHVVVLYGSQFTLIAQPAWFGVLFVVLDLLTLVVQAAGIALAVTAGTLAEASRGTDVLLAGLGLQLVSCALFLAIYWYFVYKLHHRRYILDPTFQDVYLSAKFRTFTLCMQVSVLLILGRTAGRFASLIHGFSDPLNQSEPLILVLDGSLALIAVGILTLFPVGASFRSAWRATSPQFFPNNNKSSRRNGYRRPANISLPVPAPLPQAYSPGSPPYYPVSSSPGHQMSPPLPTPPLHTFTPRSPPYAQVVQQQQQGHVTPPVKTSPGYARAPYGQGAAGVMSPGHHPVRQFVPSHRRQQTETTLVNSDALW